MKNVDNFTDKTLGYLLSRDSAEKGEEALQNVESIANIRDDSDCSVRSMAHEKNSAGRQDISYLGTIRCSHVRFSCYIRWIVKKVLD